MLLRFVCLAIISPPITTFVACRLSLSARPWGAGGWCFWCWVRPMRRGRLVRCRCVDRRSGMPLPFPLRMRHVSRAMPFGPSARTGLMPMHPMPTSVAQEMRRRWRCSQRHSCRIGVVRWAHTHMKDKAGSNVATTKPSRFARIRNGGLNSARIVVLGKNPPQTPIR